MRQIATRTPFLVPRFTRSYTVNRPEPLDCNTSIQIKNELKTDELKCKFENFNSSYKHYYNVRSESFLDIFKDFTRVLFYAACIVGLIASPELYGDWKSKRQMKRKIEMTKMENIIKKKD